MSDLFEVKLGDYVAFDPTGRDLPDCFQVGRVTARISSSTEIIDGEFVEDPRPRLEVIVNGSEERMRIETWAAIVWRNPRLCRFCGDGITSSKPDVDFCRGCFYSGEPFKEKFEACAAMIRERLGELVVAESVGIWHTGGGCFALGATLANSGELLMGGGDASLPDADQPEASACWQAWLSRTEQEAENQDGIAIPETGHATLASILERVVRELSH